MSTLHIYFTYSQSVAGGLHQPWTLKLMFGCSFLKPICALETFEVPQSHAQPNSPAASITKSLNLWCKCICHHWLSGKAVHLHLHCSLTSVTPNTSSQALPASALKTLRIDGILLNFDVQLHLSESFSKHVQRMDYSSVRFLYGTAQTPIN